MKKVAGSLLVFVAVIAMFGMFGNVNAAMMGGPGGATGPMMGGGMMGLTNSGGFGMMNGMAGAPVVGDDGTAYIVGFNSTAPANTFPSSNVFQSTVSSVTPAGVIETLTLNGLVSKPVIFENFLVATASLPDLTNYFIAGNLGTSSPSGQSVLYVVSLPITVSTVPTAVTLDGKFASVPVIANNGIYVVTSDFGNAMMNSSNTFNMMYGNYNFNSTGSAKSYLYIIGFDGSTNKITLQ